MRTSIAIALIAATTLGTVAFVRPLTAAMPGQATPANGIGIVDVEKVFNSLNERTDLQTQLQTYLTGLNDELKKIQADAKAAAETARTLPEGKEKNDAVQKAIELDATVRARQQVFEALADRRSSELFRQLYVKIQAGAKKIAETRGLSMMIATDENVQLPPGANTQETQRVIAMKRVLFAGPQHDLTNDLISLLNAEYKK